MHTQFFAAFSKPRFYCAGLAALLSLPMLASAQQEPAEQTEPESSWGLGVAALSSQKAFTDMDRDTKVLPFLTYENQYLSWMGPNLDIKLPGLDLGDSQQLDFALTAQYDFGGYDDDDIRDTPILAGMDERKGGLWAGITAKWSSPWADLSLQWLSDASGHSKGRRLSLGIERNWFFGDHLILTPKISASWLDDKEVNYLYGVQQHEARLDRPAYTASSTMNIEYGVRGMYLFNQSHSLLLDLSVTSLGSEIKDSPLVDSSTEQRALFAYIYRF
ncbi:MULTISPECIES: MipA/OmpV family protein [Rheinheimera]|uniref:MipA/OmpV family protein n=1 Tax=Rheinheimera marina TaxID=1774958 RepID=A0ABV9JJK1_9GAMM